MSAPTADRRPRKTRRRRTGTSPDPQPTSNTLGRGDERRYGTTADTNRARLPSQRFTKRRSARLRSASSGATPRSRASGSVARALRSITRAWSAEVDQRQLGREAWPERPQHALLAATKAARAQHLVAHEQHHHGSP